MAYIYSLLFDVYDKDENGKIDFLEFMKATNVVTGTDSEKLAWAFDFYDTGLDLSRIIVYSQSIEQK